MPTKCHDCHALPGELHRRGCDMERCPRCGGQAISCDCVYAVNGMDPATLDVTHPHIYENGPTPAMCAVFDKVFPNRVPYAG